jgi:hypothetical protein
MLIQTARHFVHVVTMDICIVDVIRCSTQLPLSGNLDG